MPSYQDIETRLRVVEDKIDFTMKAFGTVLVYEHPLVPGQRVEERHSLLEQYLAMKHAGLSPEKIIDVTPSESHDGSNVSNADTGSGA